jgi:hypothetical protein
MAVEALDGPRTRALVDVQNLAEIFEVESLAECRRTDEVAEDDGELATFAVGLGVGLCRGPRVK